MPDFKTPLCALAFKYGSDKCPQIKHHYTEWYYQFFLDRRESIRKILEIGVGDEHEMRWTGVPGYVTGASLRMWRDFFPSAQIYGADIKPELVFKDDRIETFQCDQAKESDLLRLLECTGRDLDVVIDDGSHDPGHQVFTCQVLMQHLPKDVVYIIEDVRIPTIIEPLSRSYRCEMTNPWKRVTRDDRLLVVRHKDG